MNHFPAGIFKYAALLVVRDPDDQIGTLFFGRDVRTHQVKSWPIQ